MGAACNCCCCCCWGWPKPENVEGWPKVPVEAVPKPPKPELNPVVPCGLKNDGADVVAVANPKAGAWVDATVPPNPPKAPVDEDTGLKGNADWVVEVGAAPKPLNVGAADEVNVLPNPKEGAEVVAVLLKPNAGGWVAAGAPNENELALLKRKGKMQLAISN